jgi:hypothetical protein
MRRGIACARYAAEVVLRHHWSRASRLVFVVPGFALFAGYAVGRARRTNVLGQLAMAELRPFVPVPTPGRFRDVIRVSDDAAFTDLGVDVFW